MAQNNTPLEKPVKVKKKKRHGCLISFLVFLVIIGVAAIIVFRVPQKIGLVKSPAERMYTQPNDTEKAALVMENLENAGLNTKGVEAYVMPVAGTEHNTAFIVLDASKGFSFDNPGTGDPVKKFLDIASQAYQQGINRAAVVYYDTAGKALMTVTVSTEEAVAYSQGKITDKQLMEHVDVKANNVMGVIDKLRTQLK